MSLLRKMKKDLLKINALTREQEVCRALQTIFHDMEVGLTDKEAVKILDRFGINVSVYNIPLCLLDKHLHKFAEQSISLWKNDYNDICKDCNLKNKCCGVFTTSNKHPYLNIAPIKNES